MAKLNWHRRRGLTGEAHAEPSPKGDEAMGMPPPPLQVYAVDRRGQPQGIRTVCALTLESQSSADRCALQSRRRETQR